MANPVTVKHCSSQVISACAPGLCQLSIVGLSPADQYCLCGRPQDHWPLERILPFMTSNPARLLKLRNKGSICVGADADLLVLSHNTLQLRYVYAKGVMRKCPQWTQVRALRAVVQCTLPQLGIPPSTDCTWGTCVGSMCSLCRSSNRAHKSRRLRTMHDCLVMPTMLV